MFIMLDCQSLLRDTEYQFILYVHKHSNTEYRLLHCNFEQMRARIIIISIEVAIDGSFNIIFYSSIALEHHSNQTTTSVRNYFSFLYNSSGKCFSYICDRDDALLCLVANMCPVVSSENIYGIAVKQCHYLWEFL